ncbi:MAG: enoyl-CoA hydratase/isomerase family protein [Verrucomicrobiae bacterium]|nr:enoyl-CoA hydratase/isomerase family protein [Verrucomicrobiae bacterium]NNJ42021.1 hypothetical protein [Akkermansiaceae bacterium]
MNHITLSIEASVATLTFDRVGSGANVFDKQVLTELESHVTAIEHDDSLTGLLVRSAKPSIFIAGADIKTLASASSHELAELLELGQGVFDRIAGLKIPSVAAIHGACAGGGCELALACDWRIVSDARVTRIGLPETLLGILPAWGGCTRLPRLIGLAHALGLILTGKLLQGSAAKYKGLADAICPEEDLPTLAYRFLKRGKRHMKGRFLEHNPLSVAVIKRKARVNIMTKTRGLYPATLEALDVVCRGVSGSHEDSLQRERNAFLYLAELPQTERMIELFFLNERAKKLKPDVAPATAPKRLNKVATIGAGVMGAGIAYWLSTRQKKVILQDVSDDALARGMMRVYKLYQGSVKYRVMSQTEAARGFDRITPIGGPIPLGDCDLIIEAATENLAIKKKIFADLSSRCGPDTILATNTSALPIRELAESILHPERLVGLHFFNPVNRMKLVEVVRTETTSPETLAAAVAFVQEIGKLPVVVKDAPGFLVNRILLPYLLEAGNLFSQGVDAQAIDDAMLDFGMPLGPIRLMDEVGLDVALHVAQTLAGAFPDRMSVPDILTRMIDANLLGKKSGKGFYLYGKNKNKSPVPNPAALALRDEARDDTRGVDMAGRLAQCMTDEAALCLEDGIVATASDIDFAMVMGTGYAPFRGGPLRYSDDHDICLGKFYT